jgi:hypothetical protein
MCWDRGLRIFTQAYALQAKKEDWASVDCFCTGVNPVNNSVSYGLWVTHKGGWQDLPRIFNARTELNLFIKQYLANRGVKYTFPVQPVSFEGVEEVAAGGENGAASRAVTLALSRSPRN